MHYTITSLPVNKYGQHRQELFEKSHCMLQVSQRQIHNNILSILSVTAEIITAAINATRAHYTILYILWWSTSTVNYLQVGSLLIIIYNTLEHPIWPQYYKSIFFDMPINL